MQKRIKSFSEFVNETFLEKPSNADILDHNKIKMEKNGYIEVTVIEPVDGLKKGDKVLIVDDLLATSGTAQAAVKLINQVAETVGIAFVIELEDLKGREKLPKSFP